MQDSSELKALVKSWEVDLNKIIVSWDLIPGLARDEFDALTQKLIGHLTSGAKKEKIYDVLNSELAVLYGLSPAEIELELFTNAIIE
jgi:hypothetical protein